MNETLCRNTRYVHPCHPSYARRYNGYCLDCANAGVGELMDRVRELEALLRQVWEYADIELRLLGAVPGSNVSQIEADIRAALEAKP